METPVFILVVVVLLVIVLALRWKGDVRADLKALGISVSLEARDKKRAVRARAKIAPDDRVS